MVPAAQQARLTHPNSSLVERLLASRVFALRRGEPQVAQFRGTDAGAVLGCEQKARRIDDVDVLRFVLLRQGEREVERRFQRRDLAVSVEQLRDGAIGDQRGNRFDRVETTFFTVDEDRHGHDGHGREADARVGLLGSRCGAIAVRFGRRGRGLGNRDVCSRDGVVRGFDRLRIAGGAVLPEAEPEARATAFGGFDLGLFDRHGEALSGRIDEVLQHFGCGFAGAALDVADVDHAGESGERSSDDGGENAAGLAVFAGQRELGGFDFKAESGGGFAIGLLDADAARLGSEVIGAMIVLHNEFGFRWLSVLTFWFSQQVHRQELEDMRCVDHAVVG